MFEGGFLFASSHASLGYGTFSILEVALSNLGDAKPPSSSGAAFYFAM
jgi:hypothetical protein